MNANGPTSAHAEFSVAWSKLKLLGTIQTPSTSLQSGEILKPTLIQQQAVSLGGPALSNLLSAAAIFAINIAVKTLSEA